MPEHEFHFVGNQAGNFESYWKPLMETLPNVTVWEEDQMHIRLWKQMICSILLGNVILLY
jgi:hypothetical protein